SSGPTLSWPRSDASGWMAASASTPPCVRTAALASIPSSPGSRRGSLWVGFGGRGPRGGAVGRDARYALHSPMENPDGVGGEFLVHGWMEQISADHPAASEIAR